MKPYRVTKATLITYSGKREVRDVDSEIYTEPIRKVKDMLLDSFIRAYNNPDDPYVKIEVRTVPLFEE